MHPEGAGSGLKKPWGGRKRLIRDTDLVLRIADGLRSPGEGTALLRALARELQNLLGATYVFVGTFEPGRQDGIQVLGGWGPQGALDEFHYSLEGTPCAQVMMGTPCVHGHGVCESFPEDSLLRQMGIEAYAGAPLVAPTGAILGVLVALFQEPLSDLAPTGAVLEIFALRVATELERAGVHERLRRREEDLRNLVHSCPMGIYEYQADGEGGLVLVRANPAADRITGIDSARLLGLSILQAFPGLVGTDIGERFLAAAHQGCAWETREFRYESNGLSGVYDIYAFQTSPGRMAVMFAEVSDRIRAETALQQSQKLEAVGRLAGGVAHDFHNLLQAIHGYADLALEDLPAGHPAANSLLQISRACERASTLTRQLLAFGRREGPALRPLALGWLIPETMQLVEPLLGETVEVRLDLAPDLLPVLADPGQVEQMLMNLCLNARDAMPSGGILTLRGRNVRLQEPRDVLRPGPYVLVSVSDTGSGIAAEIQNRVFEPFFTTKERGKGTGLGLATVYAMMRGLGGMVGFSTAEGQGTTFELHFPATEAAAPPHAPASEPPRSGGGGRLLLAEDDELARDLAVQVLSRAGYEVVATCNGSEAVQAFDADPGAFDLALLDVVMPRKGGLEVAEHLRACGSQIPVLFCSGYSFAALDEGRLQGLGAELLPKPHSPRQLLERVEALLRGSVRRR